MTEDVYDSDYLETMMDNDELSASEAGMMLWYKYDEERSFVGDESLLQAQLSEEVELPEL